MENNFTITTCTQDNLLINSFTFCRYLGPQTHEDGEEVVIETAWEASGLAERSAGPRVSEAWTPALRSNNVCDLCEQNIEYLIGRCLG